MNVVPEVEYKSLYAEAKKHSQFETFRDESLRLIESIWHHARAEGDIKQEEDVPADEPVNEGSETPVVEPVTPESSPEPAPPVASPGS